MTAREALKRTSERLVSHGREDGAAIARALLEEALDASGAALLAALDRQMAAEQARRLEEMAVRAEAGEPAQYILGHWDFFGRTFRCDRRALIPRPETELLAEQALLRLGPHDRVIDVGAGTGCIGITLKLERPGLAVTLLDVSPDALALAGENARLLGAEVASALGDMRRALPGGPYDCIVSNPPYIAADEMAALSPVVAAHEPRLALYGGEDGLDFVRALAVRAVESLTPGGWLLIEVGWRQAGAAAGLLRAALGNAAAVADLAGIPRIVIARRER